MPLGLSGSFSSFCVLGFLTNFFAIGCFLTSFEVSLSRFSPLRNSSVASSLSTSSFCSSSSSVFESFVSPLRLAASLHDAALLSSAGSFFDFFSARLADLSDFPSAALPAFALHFFCWCRLNIFLHILGHKSFPFGNCPLLLF